VAWEFVLAVPVVEAVLQGHVRILSVWNVKVMVTVKQVLRLIVVYLLKEMYV